MRQITLINNYDKTLALPRMSETKGSIPSILVNLLMSLHSVWKFFDPLYDERKSVRDSIGDEQLHLYPKYAWHRTEVGHGLAPVIRCFQTLSISAAWSISLTPLAPAPIKVELIVDFLNVDLAIKTRS